MPVPDIFLFNPTCDFAVANNTASWKPNLLLQKMERDLTNLPQFLCRQNDTVLVHDIPSEQLLEKLHLAGFTIPRFKTFNESLSDQIFISEPRSQLRPWGWSPAAHNLLKPFKASCSKTFHESPISNWSNQTRILFSRATARDLLKSLLESYKNDAFIDAVFLPQLCNSVEHIEKLHLKWGKLMIKLPWSSSGRGLQPVIRYPLHKSIGQRLKGMTSNQGLVMVEPLLNKIFDLGFLYEILPDGIQFLGYSRFYTDSKGQYRGNYLNGYPTSVPNDEKRFIDSMEKLLPSIHIQILTEMKIPSRYQGPIGIDTLIFRDDAGSLKINPILEINWRYTMGHVALNLEKRIIPESAGTFGVWFNKRKTFTGYALERIQCHPLTFESGMIASGFVPLTEFSKDNIFGAYLDVVNSHGSQSS